MWKVTEARREFQNGLSARLNAAERLKYSLSKEKTKKEIRPTVIGDLQEQRLHSLVEARARLKVVEDVNNLYELSFES